jgi:hypothetical protein
MRVRSTGLGKTEMVCQIDKVKIIDGHLMMTLQAIEPVRWHIRTVLTYKDILRLIKVGTFVILTYLVTGIKTIFSTPPPPTNY